MTVQEKMEHKVAQIVQWIEHMLYVKSTICGRLGLNFDGFCASITTYVSTRDYKNQWYEVRLEFIAECAYYWSNFYPTFNERLNSSPTGRDTQFAAMQMIAIFIDREAREIMHLVASVCPSVRLGVPRAHYKEHTSVWVTSRLSPYVCPFVCLCSHGWTVWPTTLIFGIRSDYQSQVFVCVSVIKGRIRIIARMRSIGVLIFVSIWPSRNRVTNFNYDDPIRLSGSYVWTM